MAKSKVDYWLTDDGLLLLSAWARDGLTDEQLANNMGVSVSTFYNYKRDHVTILEALKKGKEVVDIQVENALFKKAINGDITAQIFWLKNRKPKQWRDKQDVDLSAGVTVTPEKELSIEELKEIASKNPLK